MCEVVCFYRHKLFPYYHVQVEITPVMMYGCQVLTGRAMTNEALSRTPTSLFRVEGHSSALHWMKGLVVSLKNKIKSLYIFKKYIF